MRWGHIIRKKGDEEEGECVEKGATKRLEMEQFPSRSAINWVQFDASISCA